MPATLNRRTLVVGAAVMPAASIPAAAQPSLQQDAELIALGAELDRVLVERHIPQAKKDHQGSLSLNAAVDQEYLELEAAGVRLDDTQRLWVCIAVVDRLRAADPQSEARDEVESDFWDEVSSEAEELYDEIFAIEPKTLAGLAVHARATSVACAPLWHSGEDEAVNFIRRVCRMLGTSALEDDIGRSGG